jgi:dihydroflavonol-4-reductase
VAIPEAHEGLTGGMVNMAGDRGGSDQVLVTGASGFIGSATVRALIGAGYRVRVLVEPERSVDNLTGLEVERVVGDIRDPAVIDAVVDGVSVVFHLAAIYRFWAKDPDLFYDVNVGGTMNVLRAAQQANVRRVVYTSTVGTIGVARDGRVASERSVVHFEHLFGHYKRSKYLAEHEVLRAGASGLPVVLVHPTFPVGEGDSAPTPTGRTIIEFLNGRIPAYVDTALNVVHVDDVARGHVLAAERGTPGRSYILGGENMSLREMLTTLADVSGLPAPRVRLTPAMVLPIVRSAEWFQGRMLRREPTLPSEPVRMATTRMEYDDSRARTELGYSSAPARDALARAARWYLEHGFVKDSHARRIREAGKLGQEIDLRDDVAPTREGVRRS